MYQIAYKFKHLYNKKSKVERWEYKTNTCVCFVCLLKVQFINLNTCDVCFVCLLKVQFIKFNTCDKDSELCIKNKYQRNQE